MTMIDKAIEYVKEIFANDFSGHDFFHTLRVYKTAIRIAQKENAQLQIVALAALLHDVDDIKLSPQTHENKDRAVAFLRHHGIEQSDIERICQIIDEVSFVGTDSKAPDSIEGMCVQDADRLDAIGAIGIARCFSYGGSHQRVLYDPAEKPLLEMNRQQYRNHVSTTVNRFYEKLFLLKDMMNTSAAKEIAQHRHQVMEDYINEFLDEWDGEK